MSLENVRELSSRWICGECGGNCEVEMIIADKRKGVPIDWLGTAEAEDGSIGYIVAMMVKCQSCKWKYPAGPVLLKQ